ncbi:hypothetical protein JOC34_000846 [Virgibacillus halotolerans]|nr:hypothetical protein [Virgibacillus halotolerans]MBM7598489.1 hypothetical protein [Virgibacillus halotolerans]
MTTQSEILKKLRKQMQDAMRRTGTTYEDALDVMDDIRKEKIKHASEAVG